MELLPSEKIEPIIFKLGVSNSRYASLLLDYFEEDWFEDSVLGTVMDTVVKKMYGEKNKLPKPATVELLASKMFSNRDDHTQIVSKVKSALNLNTEEYDLEWIDEQMINYLKQAGLYTTVTSSLDEMEKEHKVTCLEKLEKISNMSFNEHLGLNYIEDIDEHIDELLNPESRVSTGWNSLDEVTSGGYNSDGKNLIIFMAEAGMGKSLMLSNSAANYLKKDKFVIIISLEMSEFVYGKRVGAHLSNIDINNLEMNADRLKSDISDLKLKHPDAMLVIKEFPPESISTAHIKNYIDSLVRKHDRKPDAILVDYVNLLLPNDNSSSGDNTYVKVGKVSKDLRALSYHFECPVVSATQVNRGAYDSTEIGMENISDSMGIAHTADFIGALYQEEGQREEGIINLKICKNRFGGIVGKSIPFAINYSNLVISDFDQSVSFDDDDDDGIGDLFEGMNM